MTANAAPSTEARPTLVFAVGFPVSELLVQQYKGRVNFVKTPDDVTKPEAIPVGTTNLLMHNKCFHPHRARITTLSKAVPGCAYKELSGLVALQDELHAIFHDDVRPAKATGQGAPVPPSPGPKSVPDVPAAQTQARPPIERIRAVKCRERSLTAWVRDHIKWPIDSVAVEASRLFDLASKDGFPDAKERSIESYIGTILRKAHLTSAEAAPLSAALTELQAQFADFAELFAARLKQLADSESNSAERIAELEEELDAAQHEAEELRPDALEYRKIVARATRNVAT